MSYQKLIVVGNLCREPELAYTPKGTAVCKGSIAVNRSWVSESGEKKEEVTFIDWNAWGRSGEVIAQYVKKGHKIMFEGRLKQETWEDKETKKNRSRLVMIIETFQFLDNRKEGEGNAGNQQAADAPPRSGPPPAATASGRARQAAAATGAPDPTAGDGPPDDDDNVPF